MVPFDFFSSRIPAGNFSSGVLRLVWNPRDLSPPSLVFREVVRWCGGAVMFVRLGRSRHSFISLWVVWGGGIFLCVSVFSFLPLLYNWSGVRVRWKNAMSAL